MAALKPFRFGVAGGGRGWTREEWIANSRRAEDLGYDTFLVTDHLYSDVAPIAALVAIAAATTSIRVASNVFCNDFRNPVMLAKEVATLDIFSQGRFQLGLGCGYHLPDYEQSGIAFDEPKVRVDRFKEALSIIKSYFTDEVVNFSGTYYNVKNLRGSVTHIQKPHPPIFIGGEGKRMTTIAAREADIVGISGGGSDETTRQKLGWLRDAAGERFENLELATMVFIVKITDRPEEVAREITRHFPIPELANHIHITPEYALEDLRVLLGSEDRIVEILLERRERFGVSYIQVPEYYLETFAPIVARLAGK